MAQIQAAQERHLLARLSSDQLVKAAVEQGHSYSEIHLATGLAKSSISAIVSRSGRAEAR